MFIEMVRSKIHQARVTAADLNYEGSIGIDTDLLQQAGMLPYEKVLIADIENGNRIETYIIPAAAGSREIQLNGAAARLVQVGDRVIIMAFAYVPSPVPANWQPRVLIMDDNNQIKQTLGDIITVTS
ncbi:MAG: aspartate 1-decarboxylase [Phototrophicales bacterium]|nr:MAG: aspartate 1-decarboxylase [Phototrophicales bacterium]RMG71092.1 MAG: aspartate 1-decarboxylase [Chloroflexota bacterium]